MSIADNDPGFEVEFNRYYAQEDSGSLVIGVKRGQDGDEAVSVDYFTSNGTAVAGQDYSARSGILRFAAGEPVKLVSIPILNDALREGQEKFLFTLRNPSAGSVLGSVIFAANTIFESDQGVRFERTLHAAHEFEGQLRLTVLRGNDMILGPFTVDFATSNLTATAGLDYVGTNGTLTFEAGQMQQSFAVQILNDEILEPDRQFQVMLGPVIGAAVLGDPTNSTATVTVCDATGWKPHRFGGLQVSTDGTVRLTLEGGVSARFEPFFDLHPVEVSSNLVDWTPLRTLVRTNSSTSELVYFDLEAHDFKARFYRMACTNLITPFPAPTGPYAVGRVDRLLTDPARRNRYAISTNSSFMLSIWYPAVPEAGRLMLAHLPSPIALDVLYVGADWLDRMPWFFSYSTANLRLATNQAPYPIVIQSVGGGGIRTDQQSQAEDLASHGYVVVAPDHPDTWCVLYPDGTYLSGSVGRDDGTDESLLLARVADLVFVMNQLEQWNQSDPLFAGQLNLDQVAAMGFSAGGSAVGEFCRIDRRCKAAITLDGWGCEYISGLVSFGLQKPSLMMNGPVAQIDQTLFEKARTDAFWFQISGTLHQDFGDWGWWPDATRMATGLEVSRTLHAYQVSFLNKYLKGQDDHLLDGPPGSLFPLVINFRKK